MEELGQLDKVTTVGVKKNKCKNETIKEKMAEKEVIYAGTSGKLNYKKLVKTNVILHSFHPACCRKKKQQKAAKKNDSLSKDDREDDASSDSGDR